MALPKMYAPVWIKFSSLRNGIGCEGGVVYDIDTMVNRKCRRVPLPEGGWKWQMVDYHRDREWDWWMYQDKDILDDFGSELEYEADKN